jgi:hypothetical protein
MCRQAHVVLDLLKSHRLLLYCNMANIRSGDIRKYIVQLLGVCLCIGGIALINTQSKISGNTTIKLNFEHFGSELQTSQAGVILLFLGFFLTLIPSLTFPKVKMPSLGFLKDPVVVLIALILGIFMVVTIVVLILHLAGVDKSLIKWIAGGMGCITLLVVIALISGGDE